MQSREGWIFYCVRHTYRGLGGNRMKFPRSGPFLHLLYGFRPAPHTYAIDRWRPTSENHRGLRPILSIALRKAVGMRFVAPEKEIQTLGLLSGLGSCGAGMVLLETSS